MTVVGTKRRTRGPSYDRAVIERARERRRYGESCRAIADALDVPLTTVKYWTQAITADKSGRWHLTEAAAAIEPDPAVVMRELANVMANSHGRVTAMTRDEARWVTLLARVRPDIVDEGPGSLWQLARSFIEALAAEDHAQLGHLEVAVLQGL